MKPEPSEGKQEFLKRCTTQEIASGKTKESAYTTCNSAWNKENDQFSMCLTAPVSLELKNTQNKNEQKTFLITVYTGRPVDTLRGKLAISVDGIETKSILPILREHTRDRIVGSGKTWKENNVLYAAGVFSQETVDGREVLKLAEEGYPWQASMQVVPVEVKVLRDEKESARVNDFEIKGPAEIWLKSKVGEVSFVSLGADDQTAAISMAQSNPQSCFLKLVSQYQQTHSCSKELAVKHVIKVHPEIHTAYLQFFNPGLKIQTSVEMGKQENFTEDFLGLVEQHRLAWGCTKSQAIQAVAKKSPGVHAAYIKRVNLS